MQSSFVILHNTQDFIREMTSGIRSWGRKKSVWPLVFGIKCCAIEMMSFGASRFDSDRQGVFFRASPRQADLLIIAGPATIKLREVIKRIYDQMPNPKYVIAFGECATCGGPFFGSYTIINGVDNLIPVDVYVPGCPPRPEALFVAIEKLREKIEQGKTGESNSKVAIDELVKEKHIKLWEDTNIPQKGEPIIVTLKRPEYSQAMREAHIEGAKTTQETTTTTPIQQIKIPVPNVIKKFIVHEEPNFVYVNSEDIVEVCTLLKVNEYTHLSLISAIDYKDFFEIVYHISSYTLNNTLTIKCRICEPKISSISSVWKTAQWHEREAFDLMGIEFSGHPNLKRILLPKDYSGHPLRKEVNYGNIS